MKKITYGLMYKTWAFKMPGSEDDPTDIIVLTYRYSDKTWKVKGFLLDDLTDLITPDDKGAHYAFSYYQANK